MTRFVITGLPRSRTAWFSAYLTQGEVICHHEAIRDDLKLTGEYEGTADCGYALCPNWVERLGPHKLVVIHRDPSDVAKSLRAIGLQDEIGYLPRLADRLRGLDGMHVSFHDINPRLHEIHEYLGLPGYSDARARIFRKMNIQSMDWRK